MKATSSNPIPIWQHICGNPDFSGFWKKVPKKEKTMA